ncbi:PAS domain-containing protein [Nannocystis punicea]|uniref:PAS domain-containing protein n=1 Tax=Nannocystis punicea TaxID=2995304 RepID=A0ABY7GWA4_9BACT|nr:PAS domain-containing protein [Nannocystis poenicansa]WAS91242.1 PAS domain-containing protein [Nannocystis poenicansa]
MDRASHQVPLAVVAFDLGLQVTDWNSRAEQQLGRTSAESLGRGVVEVLPVKGGEATWRGLLAGDDGSKVRTSLEDGRTYEWWIAAARDGEGRQVGVVCYGAEVTDRVVEERQIRVEQAALRGFLDNLPTSVTVFDRDGTFLLMDGKGLEPIGIKPGQFVGQNVFSIYGDNSESAEFIRRGLAGIPTPKAVLEQYGRSYECWHIPSPPDVEAALVGISIEVTESRQRERDLLEKLELIERQQRVIRELSTPIIEVWEGIVALPIIGLMDSVRTAELMDNLLQAVGRLRAHYAILDMTGIEVVDTATAGHLLRMIRAIRLLGAEGIITGINAGIAQTIVTQGLDLRDIVVHATLREALKHCITAESAGRASTARAAADPVARR